MDDAGVSHLVPVVLKASKANRTTPAPLHNDPKQLPAPTAGLGVPECTHDAKRHQQRRDQQPPPMEDHRHDDRPGSERHQQSGTPQPRRQGPATRFSSVRVAHAPHTLKRPRGEWLIPARQPFRPGVPSSATDRQTQRTVRHRPLVPGGPLRGYPGGKRTPDARSSSASARHPTRGVRPVPAGADAITAPHTAEIGQNAQGGARSARISRSQAPRPPAVGWRTRRVRPAAREIQLVERLHQIPQFPGGPCGQRVQRQLQHRTRVGGVEGVAQLTAATTRESQGRTARHPRPLPQCLSHRAGPEPIVLQTGYCACQPARTACETGL